MFESKDEKLYLEVPEVADILGLSKSQIYSLSGDQLAVRKDPRNNSRTLFEAEEVFLARRELEDEGQIGEKNFRKWEEDIDFEEVTIARSAINKMYRNRYNLDDLDLLRYVNNKRRKKMDRDSEAFRDEFKHVENTCFGWADESNEECTEHCNLFEECREERNQRTLARLAKQFNESPSEPIDLESGEVDPEDLTESAEQVKEMSEEMADKIDGLI